MSATLIEAFISYSRKNKEFVKTLADSFEQVDKSVWIDWEGIPHGSEWWKEIESGIENANNFIFVITPDSLVSKVCQQELAHAVKHNKRLIPILYQEVNGIQIPQELAKIDWIFFRETDDFKQSFVELLKTIDTDLESVRMHTRLTRRAVEWQQNKYDKSYLLRGNDLRRAQQWLTQTHANPKSPKPTTLQTQYTVKSAQTESKHQRFQLMGVGVMLLIAAVLGVVSYYQWLSAEEQEDIAKQERNASILNNIEAFAHLSSAQLATDNRLDALLSATKSARLLVNKSDWFNNNAQLKAHFLALHELVPRVLREAIYGAQELNRLEWHDDKVQTLAFTPDGKKLVSGSSDTTVKIWQRDGKLLHTLHHKSSVYGVSVSRDSRLIVSAGRDYTVKLWDIDGNFLNEFKIPGIKIRDVNISRDGQFIAAACDDSIVRVWRINGQPLWDLKGHEGAVQTVKFSPESVILASGGDDRTIRLWDMKTGELLSTLKGHHDRILAVDFHPTMPRLISGSSDNTVKFWTLINLRPLIAPYNSLLAHKNWIYDVEYSADGNMFATASANGSIKLWSSDGTLLEEFDKPGVRMTDVSFSEDGELLSSAGGDNTIRIYALKTLVSVKRLEGHTSGLKDLDYSPGGNIIASTATDGTIRLWNSDNYRLLTTIKTNGNIRDVDFAMTDKGYMLLAAGYNNTVQFWKLGGEYEQPDKELKQEGRLLSIAVHPSNKVFATTHSNDIQLWTIEGEKIKLLKGHTEGINTVVYSHDGKYLASGGADDIVIIWDEQGNKLHTLKGHYSWINNISFSPNDHLIATASSDKTIGLWRTSDGQLVDMLKGHEDWVWDVNFYPDPEESLLVSGGADNTIRVWDYNKNQLLITLKGHDGWVRAVSFSPNGHEIASGGADQRLIIWETESVRKRFLIKDMTLQVTESLQVSCRLLKDYLTNNNRLSEGEKKVCQNLDALQTVPLTLDSLNLSTGQ